MTNPLETSTWEAMKVCGCAGAGKALLVVSGVPGCSMVRSVVTLVSLLSCTDNKVMADGGGWLECHVTTGP